MAERIRTYEQSTGAPSFNADTSSMRAAVNEIGRTAAVVGNEARSGMRRARVLDQAGDFAYKIGEWAAKERGKRRELEPIRDEAGVLVPGEMRATLNLERQIYNDRWAEKWANGASVDFRKEANASALRIKDDQAAYTKHMQEYSAKLLENAPETVRAGLEDEFSRYAEQQGFTLAQVATRKGEQRLTASLTEANIFDMKDIDGMILRDDATVKGEDGAPVPGDDGNVVVSPGMQEAYNRMMGRFDLYPNIGNAEQARQELGAQLTTTGAKGLYARKARTSYNEMLARGMPLADFEGHMMQVKASIEQSDIPFVGVPGTALEGLSGMTYDQMSFRQQELVSNWMDGEASRLAGQYKANKDLETNEFLYVDAVQRVESMNALRIDTNTNIGKAVQGYAVPVGVDPMLVMSMVGVESGGNPNATSAENTGGRGTAKGLMQIIPETWASLRKEMGLPHGNPYDPQQNLQTGVYYISKLNKIIDEKLPGLPPREKSMLATVGYYGGEGRLSSLMAEPTFSAYDINTWSPYNENKPGQPSEKEHVAKVMRRYDANTGGNQAVMAGLMHDANSRFANDPRQRMQAISGVYDMARKASSWTQYNQALTYQPPVMNMDMAKQWVSTAWNASANATDPNTFAPTYESIMQSIGPHNAHKNMLQTAAFQKYQSAIGSYKNSNAVQTMDAMTSVDMRNKTATQSDINGVTKGLPQQGSFEAGGSPNTPAAFHAYVQAGSPFGEFSEFFYNRQTYGGKQVNGVPNQESVSLMGYLAQQVGETALADPAMLEQLIKVSKKLMQPAATGALPPIGYGSEQQNRMLNNIAKQVGSPAGKASDFKRGMKYLWRNEADILKSDPEALAKVRARFNGEVPPDAVIHTGEEKAAILSEGMAYLESTGLQDVWRTINDKMPNSGYISADLKEHVQGIAVDLMDGYAPDEAEDLFDEALEQAMRDNRIGIAPWGFARDVQGRKDYRPGSPVAHTNPWLPTDESFVANKEVYEEMGNHMITIPTTDGGTEEVPASIGTAAGLLQNAYDSTKREDEPDIDMFGQLGKSIFVTRITGPGMVKSPGGNPAHILEVVQRQANENGDVIITPLFQTSTGEMVDVQNSMASPLSYDQVLKASEGKWVRVLRDVVYAGEQIAEAFNPFAYDEAEGFPIPPIGPKELIVDPLVGAVEGIKNVTGAGINVAVQAGKRIEDMADIVMEN